MIMTCYLISGVGGGITYESQAVGIAKGLL